MSRLHELAQRLGVETLHISKVVMAQNTENAVAMDVHCHLPDKDIAHDMLEALPWGQDLGGMLAGVPRFCLYYKGPADRWWWLDQIHDVKHPFGASGLCTFEEAVCALAERHLEQKP